MLNDVVISNKLYTKMNISDPALLDDISLKVLKQDAPDFLLPMKTMNIDGETEIRFEIMEGIRLSYFNEKVHKKDFVTLIKNMLMPFKNCADWFLDYHNILLDPQYIILKRNDLIVRYVYIPQKEKLQTEDYIIKFFENILVKIELVDDPGYTLQLLRILRESSSNLMGLFDAVMKDSVDVIKPGLTASQNNTPQRVNNPEPMPYAANQPVNKAPRPDELLVSAVKEETAASYAEPARPGQMKAEFGKKDVEGALINKLFGGNDEEDDEIKKGFSSRKEKQVKEKTEKEKPAKGSGFLGGFFKKNEEQQSYSESVNQPNISHKQVNTQSNMVSGSISQPLHQNFYMGSDPTEIDNSEDEKQDANMVRLQLEDYAGYTMPQLIELDVTKGYATVGRFDKTGYGACDFNFNATLTFISRSHFRIVKNGSQIQIIDLGSGNGTFVNGVKIVPNVAFIVNKGDIIMFSTRHRVTYRVL